MHNINHDSLLETLNHLVIGHALNFEFTVLPLPADLMALGMEGITVNHCKEWQEKGVKIPVCYVIYLTGKQENELEKIIFDLIFYTHNDYIRSFIQIPILILSFGKSNNSAYLQEKISKDFNSLIFQFDYVQFGEYIARAKHLLEFSDV